MILTIDKPFLACPVSWTAPCKRLEFLENGKLVYDLAIPLDMRHPDYTTYVPIRHLLGKTLILRTVPDMALSLRLTDRDESVRQPRLRPHFHFSAKQGWINDPNGLCFADGVYHLFYQHNPAFNLWENMHWGHAVSPDLLHWTEREPALYPDELGTMYSGSAVVDFDNRSGLGDGATPPVLLYYTAQGGANALSAGKPPVQCLAYSRDGGKTFQKYAGNPIIPRVARENRDPKVVYHAATDRYILVLFLDKHDYGLFVSDNLLDWSLFQIVTVEDEWECPDFFPLPLDGDAGKEKWVLIGAYDRYLVGSFDGTAFRAEQPVQRLHRGNASYAAQSWFNLKPGDRRRVRISWNNRPMPSAQFGLSMNAPQELTLRRIGGVMRLCAQPAEELKALYRDTREEQAPALPYAAPLSEAGYDLQFYLQGNAGAKAEIAAFGLRLTADWAAGELRCGEVTAPLETDEKGRVRLRMLLDTLGAEIFVGDGQIYMTVGQILDPNLDRLEVSGEAVRLEHVRITQLADTAP